METYGIEMVAAKLCAISQEATDRYVHTKSDLRKLRAALKSQVKEYGLSVTVTLFPEGIFVQLGMVRPSDEGRFIMYDYARLTLAPVECYRPTIIPKDFISGVVSESPS